MGVIIKATGVNAEANATSYALTVRDGAKCLHFLNESVKKACINYAPNGIGKGEMIGAPTEITATHMRFDNRSGVTAAGVKTALIEPRHGTYFVVARAPNIYADGSDLPSVFGSYMGPLESNPSIVKEGTALYFHSTLGILTRSGYEVPTLSYSVSGLSASGRGYDSWKLFVCVIDEDRPYVYDKTNNLTGNYPVSGLSTRKRSTNNIYIGMNPNVPNNTGGIIDIAAFLAYDRVLSSSEIEAAAGDLRRYILSKGIAV